MAKSAKMSSLRKNSLAILCSDIHLSHKPPIARSVEPDWYMAMMRPLDQVKQLQHDLEVPVICAGDIFDKWNVPPELINFAMTRLPKKMLCVPGQHDLPFHRLQDIKKSAYWTLAKAKVIDHLEYDEAVDLCERQELWVHGFPWECEVRERKPDVKRAGRKDVVHLAVIHHYIWHGKNVFKGASADDNLNTWSRRLGGYDAAVFGDNHKGFYASDSKPAIINCGTFMRRKIDEINYEPMVGILLKDGWIEPYYLDCSEDKFIDVDKALAIVETSLELSEFIKDLSSLRGTALNFKEAVVSFMKEINTDHEVRKLILEYME